MLRSLSYAAAAATLAATAFAPAAIAEGETVNVNISIDATRLTDKAAADRALRSLERQARKACRYEITSMKRKVTDWRCVDNIIDQTVTQLDVPMLTAAHSTSDRIIQIAERADRQEAS